MTAHNSGIIEQEYLADDNGDDSCLSGNKLIIDLFNENISFVETTKNGLNDNNEKFIVVLYGYVIASIESYLYFTFYKAVVHSDYFEEDGVVSKWINSDKYFNETKTSLKDMFNGRNFDYLLKEYIKEIIFHKIEKIKPMYKAVLGVSFETDDMNWLSKAIINRHDCVHRAGYNKEGNKIHLSKSDLDTLIDKSKSFVNFIEERLKT